MAALVLALNPSIDAEWRVDDVVWEEKNVVLSERRWAGGKGINVARWLRHLGEKPRLLLPLGGLPGKELQGCLRDDGLPATILPLREPTRVNVIVTPKAGRQLRFNPPGPRLVAAEWKAVFRTTGRLLKASSCLVLSGSLPRGLPIDSYAELIRLARRAGVQTVLDCDGATLAAAVKAQPFLVKPNEHELAMWYGKPIRDDAVVRRAARAMSQATSGWVLVSRGPRPSLLVNTGQGAEFSVLPPQVRIVNTVGAGDALLAAVVAQIEHGLPPVGWLQHGIAAGTAAVACAAGELPTLERVRRLAVQIR